MTWDSENWIAKRILASISFPRGNGRQPWRHSNSVSVRRVRRYHPGRTVTLNSYRWDLSPTSAWRRTRVLHSNWSIHPQRCDKLNFVVSRANQRCQQGNRYGYNAKPTNANDLSCQHLILKLEKTRKVLALLEQTEHFRYRRQKQVAKIVQCGEQQDEGRWNRHRRPFSLPSRVRNCK